MATLGPNWKIFGRIACVGVSLLGLGVVFSRIDLESLRRAFSHARLSWIVASWGMFGIALLLAAARWHLVLRLSQCQVHGLATSRTVIIGHLFNTLFFGPTGGDIGKSAFYAGKYGFAASPVLATCALDRFLGGVGFFVFVAFTPGFAIYRGHWTERMNSSAGPARWPLWIALAAIAGITFLFLKNRFHWKSPFEQLSTTFKKSGWALLRTPKIGFRGVCLAVICHFCTSCVFLFSVKAVTDATFSMAAVFWVFPVIAMITAAPVTFAGTGLREGAALFFLGQYGIPAADAVAASLLVLVTYFVWAIAGALLFWRESSKKARWPRAKSMSAVILTMNDEEKLPATVASVRQIREVKEVIVADGVSRDRTREVAERLGCEVVEGHPSQGAQMRAAAAAASGDVLLYLNTASSLPPDAGEAVLNCLRDSHVVAGGFWKRHRGKPLFTAGAGLQGLLRMGWSGRLLLDPTLFARRGALQAMDGLPNVPLLERFELCRRLQQVGRFAVAGATVTTSTERPERSERTGMRLKVWYLTLRYYLGAEAETLREIHGREDLLNERSGGPEFLPGNRH